MSTTPDFVLVNKFESVGFLCYRMFHHLACPVDPPYVLAGRVDVAYGVAGAVAVGVQIGVVLCLVVWTVEHGAVIEEHAGLEVVEV